MYVSPRFRDIFSRDPISVRRGDATGETIRREAISDVEFDKRAGELQIDLIWLEIAHAHRKAARAFTPELTSVGELATDDR